MRVSGARVLLCAVLALSGATTALADPANDLVGRMAAAVAGLGDYEVRFASTFSMDAAEGSPPLPPTAVRICREGPVRVLVECAAEAGDSRIVSNEAGIYAYVSGANQYVSLPPVAARGEFATAYEEQMLGLALEFEPGALPQMLFSSDPTLALPFGEEVGWAVVGEEPIAGIACAHLRLRDADEEIHLWVRQEGPALPMAIALRFSIQGDEGQPARVVEAFRSEVVSWDLEPSFAADMWQWAAPEGAELVETLAPTEGAGEPTPLLGETAPDFALADLDGKPVQLAEVLDGDTIVVIDFWATWCGPCLEALPVYTKIAREYKDRGVVFLAVSQGDTAEEIAQCLSELRIAPHVLLDTDSQVGATYGAEGIPHMVLVGKDGVIRAVHVGWGPDSEERTRADLDALLAGETPPSAAEAPGVGEG